MNHPNNHPKLHNAAWPGVVGKGSPGAEPFIDLDTMLDLTAKAEVDGVKFNAGAFIIRNADRSQLEKAAAELGLHIHSTSAAPNVATHPISAARVGIVHNWQNTQNDGWYRIAFDEFGIPYTYVADTWLRENPNLREKFDVLIFPPMGGGGAAGLSSELRGLPMRGSARP